MYGREHAARRTKESGMRNEKRLENGRQKEKRRLGFYVLYKFLDKRNRFVVFEPKIKICKIYFKNPA